MAAGALAGCVATAPVAKPHYEPEEFGSTTTHTRVYAASEAQTCEAARRALLSQGYLVTTATDEQVVGRNGVIHRSSPVFWEQVEAMLMDAAEKGILPKAVAQS